MHGTINFVKGDFVEKASVEIEEGKKVLRWYCDRGGEKFTHTWHPADPDLMFAKARVDFVVGETILSTVRTDRQVKITFLSGKWCTASATD